MNADIVMIRCLDCLRPCRSRAWLEWHSARRPGRTTTRGFERALLVRSVL